MNKDKITDGYRCLVGLFIVLSVLNFLVRVVDYCMSHGEFSAIVLGFGLFLVCAAVLYIITG